MVSILEKLETIGQQVRAKEVLELNIAFINKSREDWVANFPNKWVAVDNESIILVDIDYFNLFRTMDRRDVMTDSIVFYYSNNYHIPIIVKLCDVKTT